MCVVKRLCDKKVWRLCDKVLVRRFLVEVRSCVCDRADHVCGLGGGKGGRRGTMCVAGEGGRGGWDQRWSTIGLTMCV